MKALVYGGPGAIACEAVADPVLSGPGSVVVRTTLCGLCGSDLHPYHVDMGRTGYCIGHEAVGEVVEAGPEMRRFKVGDRVVVAGSLGCGACAPCASGQVMLCANTPYTRVFGQGMPGIGGCQAQAVEVPTADQNLMRLEAGMSDDLGIMLADNLPTAWLCARKARVGPGSVAAVIGLGAVGLQAVLAARAMGAERVFAVDLLEDRRAAAARLGAIPISGADVAGQIREATGGAGVDAAMDATGGPQTAEIAIDVARKGGVVSIIGVPEARSIPFPALSALAKNLEIALSSCSIQAQWPEILQALEDGRLSLDAVTSLVTHRLPLDAGAEAYALFDAKRDGVKKLVFTT